MADSGRGPGLTVLLLLGGCMASAESSNPASPAAPTHAPKHDEDVLASDQSNVCLSGPGSFRFGMAQTGLGEAGWYGEDCLPGDAGSPGTDLCHTLAPHGGTDCLLHVDDREEVVESRTTLFTNRIEDLANNTFAYLFDDGCVTYGANPEYYTEALGCEVQ